jgi:hypothetical protein
MANRGSAGVQFGPVNATAFVTQAYAQLNAEGLIPASAWDVGAEVGAGYSSNGQQLSFRWLTELNVNQSFWVEALFNADGTFQLETNQTFPMFIPVQGSQTVPADDPPPGFTSPFLAPQP